MPPRIRTDGSGKIRRKKLQYRRYYFSDHHRPDMVFCRTCCKFPVYFPVSGRCTISDRILTYRYVRSGKPGNYDAPRYNRFGLCIRNRFPTWNDHGIFASAPAMDVPVYQFIETGSDHGLGTACHCMVWYRRRTYTFLIAFSGVFTIILNTIAGVQDISKDFYNAARSMGAGTLSIIKDIVIPGSLPGVLTGLRLAIGLGWMSVI